jgi:hypothetical protein
MSDEGALGIRRLDHTSIRHRRRAAMNTADDAALLEQCQVTPHGLGGNAQSTYELFGADHLTSADGFDDHLMALGR